MYVGMCVRVCVDVGQNILVTMYIYMLVDE